MCCQELYSTQFRVEYGMVSLENGLERTELEIGSLEI